jgi:hypothetical protein
MIPKDNEHDLFHEVRPKKGVSFTVKSIFFSVLYQAEKIWFQDLPRITRNRCGNLYPQHPELVRGPTSAPCRLGRTLLAQDPARNTFRSRTLALRRPAGLVVVVGTGGLSRPPPAAGGRRASMQSQMPPPGRL